MRLKWGLRKIRKRQCNGWKSTASKTGGNGAAKIAFRHMVTAVQIADHSFDYLLTVLDYTWIFVALKTLNPKL